MPTNQLSLELGTDEEVHDHPLKQGQTINLHRPYLKFRNGLLDEKDVFQCTFTGDALFFTRDKAIDYMKEVLETLTKPVDTYNNLHELEKARGKTEDHRS